VKYFALKRPKAFQKK